MNNKKKIDRLFQEKFKDFEKTPNDNVWSNIEAKLNKSKNRRIAPIWWRYAGVAALLLISLTIGKSFFNSTGSDLEDTTIQVVDSENDKTNSTIPTEKHIIESEKTINVANSNVDKAPSKHQNNITTQSKPSVSKNLTNTTIADNPKEVINNKYTSPKRPKILTEKNIQIAKTTEKQSFKIQEKKNVFVNSNISTSTSEKPNNSLATNTTELEEKSANNSIQNKTSNTESIEDAIAKNETINKKEKEHSKKWSVSPNAAPVYFNTLGEGSSIASQFNSNSKTGEVNMSYGINASYAINKKLIVRSGINRVNLGYNTNNVAVFESINSSSQSSVIEEAENAGVPINDNISTDVSLVSSDNLKSADIAPESFTTASSANINQNIGFIEIPIEFQYILSDKKLGLNVIGGFSSFFLNNNELFSETGNSRTLIGEAVNVNNVSYSANFGFGLNYKVTKKINLNFEPMFKYQINTFNNTSGDFKPFFIGVYTGFGIKF